MSGEQSVEIDVHPCACGHGLNWHHEVRGCGYNGYGQKRCQCFLTFDEAVTRYTAARKAQWQAEALRAEAKEIFDTCHHPAAIRTCTACYDAFKMLRARADIIEAECPTPPAGGER